MEFARNVQNTGTKRESRTLSLKHLLFQVPCERPRLVNGAQTCSCWEFLVILSELQVLGSFRSNSDVVGLNFSRKVTSRLRFAKIFQGKYGHPHENVHCNLECGKSSER